MDIETPPAETGRTPRHREDFVLNKFQVMMAYGLA